MKKAISILLLITFVISICLISCKQKNNDENSADTSDSTYVEPTGLPEETSDTESSNETLTLGDGSESVPSLNFGDLVD